jgi:hypothetical protein
LFNDFLRFIPGCGKGVFRNFTIRACAAYGNLKGDKMFTVFVYATFEPLVGYGADTVDIDFIVKLNFPFGKLGTLAEKGEFMMGGKNTSNVNVELSSVKIPRS